MSINPYILLGIGGLFAVLYGCVITFGWARTRHNRRLLQDALGVTRVPLVNLDAMLNESSQMVKVPSLTNNYYCDVDGNAIDLSKFKACVAKGESSRYPAVKPGDLVLIDDEGTVKYVFEIPELKNFR